MGQLNREREKSTAIELILHRIWYCQVFPPSLPTCSQFHGVSIQLNIIAHGYGGGMNPEHTMYEYLAWFTCRN